MCMSTLMTCNFTFRFDQMILANQTLAVAAMQQRCISAIRTWMLNDELMLNDDKTELILFGTRQLLTYVFEFSGRVGDVNITSAPIVGYVARQ